MSARNSILRYSAERILCYNTNSLPSRKDKLSHFLHIEDINIALIAETYPTSRLNADIYNYKLYICNHSDDAAHGESAI